MLQPDVQSGNYRWRAAFQTLFTANTEQPRAHNYFYAYSDDIRNLATIVLLSQQLFTVLFSLIKFKTLGLMVEPDLANDESFFRNVLSLKSY